MNASGELDTAISGSNTDWTFSPLQSFDDTTYRCGRACILLCRCVVFDDRVVVLRVIFGAVCFTERFCTARHNFISHYCTVLTGLLQVLWILLRVPQHRLLGAINGGKTGAFQP